MKHSPLCMREEGKEVMFTATDGVHKYRFVLPRAMLDDVCGTAATTAERKKWVGAHMADILTARPGAIAAADPRVHVEEII